ncbi:ABC transporter ATP-binding protein [Leekyejoonella antrihumi]|uniref:ABC transporter ATP-binding protein n=1 Tax=Leekyejoonella antrihumi TaxID=1660198 RepID=A0A563E6A0_9MICO|nr:ABC transporter ATP-binding protein [Leekyejoonella antrihumi]TWP38046.1 ABC transporter ATP-binding protein [Leekyejoonella antrihumi]
MSDETAHDILLSARGLVRDFGPFRAVDGVDLDVRSGTIHSVIGPNGAGKTTLFRLLTGILRPTAGSLEFAGEQLAGRPTHVVARRGIVQAFQTTSIFPRLTAHESVCAALVSKHRRSRDLITWFHRGLAGEASQVLETVGLSDVADEQARALSHGDQRALEVALALAMSPRLLLLDEPTAGMSPFESHKMVQLVQRLAKEEQLTVILSEHDMDTVFGISDRVSVMHQGRVLADGPAPEVRRNADVMAIYLGSEA